MKTFESRKNDRSRGEGPDAILPTWQRQVKYDVHGMKMDRYVAWLEEVRKKVKSGCVAQTLLAR